MLERIGNELIDRQATGDGKIERDQNVGGIDLDFDVVTVDTIGLDKGGHQGF